LSESHSASGLKPSESAHHFPFYFTDGVDKLVRLGVALLAPASYRARYEGNERSEERPEDEPK
jgi:hypothetical protein